MKKLSLCDQSCRVKHAEGLANSARLWYEGYAAIAGGLTAVVIAVIALLGVQEVAELLSGVLDWLGLATEAVRSQLEVLAAGLGLVAALGVLLVWQFDTESTQPDSWWTLSNFSQWSSSLMGVMNQLQRLAIIMMALVSGLLNKGGPVSTVLKTQFGVLGAIETFFVGVTLAEAEANQTLREQAGIVGWQYVN